LTTLYAHRGACAELPENTLASFERALEVGADALEMDVHATRDGVIVVSHDPGGERCFGVQQLICETDWDGVSRWGSQANRAPRLLDVVRAFPGVPLNVDLKAGVADLAVELLRAERAEERVTLASFSASTLRRVRALGYKGPTGLARSEVAQLVALPASVQRGPLAPAGNAAQLPVNLAQRWLVDRCKALGLRVDIWTVNDAPTAQRLMALGVDGIMTDDPASLAPTVKRR
jgi:glycerophosphoryl diester phosphodiesterase